MRLSQALEYTDRYVIDIVENDSPDVIFTNPKTARMKEFLKRYMED